MSKEMLLLYRNSCNPECQKEFWLALQCAPVLKGVSIGTVISLEVEVWNHISLPSVFGSSQISIRMLWSGKKKVILLIYRSSQLEQYLKEQKVSSLLRRMGYDIIESDTVLRVFQQRYQAYQKKRRGFPHELGLLLGYPAVDVEGYIKNQGRNCLMSGYWKVYGELPRAEMLFEQYDLARLWAAHQIVSGYSLKDMMVSQGKL